jgi:hypothetical protein
MSLPRHFLMRWRVINPSLDPGSVLKFVGLASREEGDRKQMMSRSSSNV